MARITQIVALFAASVLAADAFTGELWTNAFKNCFLTYIANAFLTLQFYQTTTVSSMPRQSLATLRMADDDMSSTEERGVSLDQDGKSNVWAIEPKVEVQSKSSEEQTTSALLAIGGLAVFAAFAGGILTNLPDPNQF